jgi:sec-independent protein translocase protein TatB
MFDIGWGELMVIGIVALVAIGPKELPGVLRMLGQWMGKIRRMAGEFQSQFQEAMREAEMADLKKQFDETASTLTSQFDPIGYLEDNKPKASEAPASSDAAAASASTPSTPEPTAPAAAEPVLPPPEPAPEVTEQDLAAPADADAKGGRAA